MNGLHTQYYVSLGLTCSKIKQAGGNASHRSGDIVFSHNYHKYAHTAHLTVIHVYYM